MDDYFQGTEDYQSETEIMEYLLRYISCLFPIVLFLVGNEIPIAETLAHRFLSTVRLNCVHYHAFCQYENVNNGIWENARQVFGLNSRRSHPRELKTLATIVNDEKFVDALVKSRNSLESRNDVLSKVRQPEHSNKLKDHSFASSDAVRHRFCFVLYKQFHRFSSFF